MGLCCAPVTIRNESGEYSKVNQNKMSKVILYDLWKFNKTPSPQIFYENRIIIVCNNNDVNVTMGWKIIGVLR